MKIYVVISDDPMFGPYLEGTFGDRSDAEACSRLVSVRKNLPVAVMMSEFIPKAKVENV